MTRLKGDWLFHKRRLHRFGGEDKLTRLEEKMKFYGFRRWNEIGLIVKYRIVEWENRFGRKKVVEKEVVVPEKKKNTFHIADWPKSNGKD